MFNTNYLLKLCLVIAIAIFFVRCEEQPITIPDFDDVNDTGRVVLIEEISGVKCPNCPAGAAKVEEIRQAFPGRVVSIVYHTPFLGQPFDNSMYDFRTVTGLDIENHLGQYEGKPSASINRKKFSDQMNVWVASIESWSNYVVGELEESPKANLDVNTTFDEATRKLDVDITINPLEDLNGEFTISAMIIENHIIDTQEDNSVIVPDYEHNHVFRHALMANSTGDNVGSSLTTGTPVTKSYSYELPAEEGWWVAENCEVVVFLTHIENGVREVLQAAEVHVVEE